MFYKIRNNNAPSYLCDCLLPFERNENACNLRNQTDYSNPFTRLQLYRNSFFPSSINNSGSFILNLFNFIKKLSRLWVIITLILQNQLTFGTGFWGSRTWKLDNISFFFFSLNVVIKCNCYLYIITCWCMDYKIVCKYLGH
jgi:hypothetical protein